MVVWFYYVNEIIDNRKELNRFMIKLGGILLIILYRLWVNICFVRLKNIYNIFIVIIMLNVIFWEIKKL